ncbi:MAG: stage III sporulation protein AD [Oscillospiraceae bacterium]|nr:stage III sporulation protein AD [Oscillospiraceae bacterium]
MELLLKIAAGAVTAALCAAVLRKNAPEFALLVMLCAGVWVLMQMAQPLGQVTRTLTHLVSISKLDARVVEPVVKVVGLSIVTRVTGEVCRSAGDGGIAAFVETAGTVLALAATLPLAQAVVEMITGLLA